MIQYDNIYKELSSSYFNLFIFEGAHHRKNVHQDKEISSFIFSIFSKYKIQGNVFVLGHWDKKL